MLATPPVRRVVPERVFDAFGWCASSTLEHRSPGPLATDTPLDGSDPARMVFVFRDEAAWARTGLPRELARLHAFGLGLTDETALAPYAIDDATDGLYARRVAPAEVLWLAADNLNAVYWGLHDWAHFHNHGPFTERAYTELQCDYAAVTWLTINAAALGLDDATLRRVRAEVTALARGRFAAEGLAPDENALAVLWTPTPP
jgi:hypothetical protein